MLGLVDTNRIGMDNLMKRLLINCCCIIVLIGFTGCAIFAPDPRTTDQLPMPATFLNGAPAAEITQKWWQNFNNSQLNHLVEEALGGNFSLQESWARLRQTQALAAKAGANLWPNLSVEGSGSYGRQGVYDADENTTTTSTVESYSIGLVSSYEIDLWGRIQSDRQAALLSASASRQDLNAAAITLAAKVVTTWIEVQSQRMQIELLNQQLKANLTLLELMELRFRKSLASALDVFQQRQVVAQSRSELPLARKSERLLLHELAVLLGRTPFSLPDIETDKLEIPEDVPATGIPAQLLTARPDLQAALMRLSSADWEVASARADRLPNISLTAKAKYQSDKLNVLFDNWLLSLAGSLTAPLLDGHQRAAEVDRQYAVVDEELAAYRGLVLNAIREVEDALVSESKLREHIAELLVQLDASQNALNEARSRYRNGLNDYLPVLTHIFSVQKLERTLIQRKAELLEARVDLYRALGGTWTDTLEPRAAN